MPNWRPNLKKEDFFFDQKEKKLFLLSLRLVAVIAGACLMALMITAGLVTAVRSIAGGTRVAPGAGAEAVSVIEPAGEEKMPRPTRLTLSHFMLPAESGKAQETEAPLFRERTGRWDEKTIALFWVPPERIGLEKLRALNDKEIERLFEDIP